MIQSLVIIVLILYVVYLFVFYVGEMVHITYIALVVIPVEILIIVWTLIPFTMMVSHFYPKTVGTVMDMILEYKYHVWAAMIMINRLTYAILNKEFSRNA